MPNSYTQIHIQFVFAVKCRSAVINIAWKQELHKYITCLFKDNNHKVLQINSMPDHVHILVGVGPHQSISTLIQHVKTQSSKWINFKGFCSGTFAWQNGYGAFSYAKSQVEQVIRYIQNQEAHHKKETFLNEYKKFLTAFDIIWEEQYVFKELE